MLCGFEKALLQKPREMIRGRIFREMIRVSAQSQSYKPKVGVTDQKSELQPGRPPESEPNRPEKGPEWGLGASTENPLKAFLNPAKLLHIIFQERTKIL